MLALEERIVLDATLVSALLTATVNLGDSVDLSGPNGWDFRVQEAGPGLVPATAGLKIDGGGSFASAESVLRFPPFSFDGINFIYDYRINFSGVQAVQFNTVGVHDVFIDFVDPDTPDLKVATITVIGETTPPVVNQTFDFSGNEGTTLTHQLLARVTEANSLTVGWSYSSDNPAILISNFTKAPIDGTDQWNVYGDITITDRVNSTHTIGVQDNSGNTALFTVKVTGLDAPITEIDLPQINAVEGSSLTHLEIARFNNANSLGDPTLMVDVFVPGFTILTSPQIEYNTAGNYYSVVLDAQFRSLISSGGFTVILRDTHDGTNLSFFTPLQVTDAPFTIGSPLTILANPGSLFNGKVGSFIDGNPFEALSNYSASFINWGDGTSSAATLVALGNGAYDVYGSHTYAFDPAGLSASFVIQDGVEGSHQGAINLITSTPVLVPGSVLGSSGIEGRVFDDLNILSFTSADPNAQASDFNKSLLISTLPGTALSVTDLKITKDASGVFHFTGDFALGNDITFGDLTMNVTHIASGQQIATFGSLDITQAPKTLGAPLSLSLPLGLSNMVKIGSFTDANLLEPQGNYRITADNDSSLAGDGDTTASLVQTGAGAYDIYANLNYGTSGVKNGTYQLFEVGPGGATEPGSLISGNFSVTVAAPSQLLWGIDENTGKLFSVSDYSQAGAANRVTVYGQLHTAAGVIIGSGIDAFTIDAADANGNNAAYFAVSKAVAGINTFSIGVIADINDLAHNTEVKLYSISGMSFNMSKDAITGLAVDPITGNLLGTVVSGGTKSTLFVVDKNSLQSANQVAKAYTLGNMVGSDDTGTQLGTAINQLLGLFGINDLVGGLKVNNARDMAFDSAGRLFVTDGAKDILYQINVGNGEIIGIANAKEANGLASNPNIEALAWDPIAGKLIGANSVANMSDLIGLSVTGGANSLDVANLQNLQDIQGMAFKPQFAFHSGQDLGTLVDFANTDVEYQAGGNAIFLLKSVDLVTFGDNNYGGGSLNVDVADNANSLTDQLAISNGSNIKVVNSEVRYKGLLIGMIDAIENGKNGKDLTIHFNTNASEKAVEALMSRITYMNTASSLVLGNKSVAFSLLDSLGAVIGYTTVDIEIEKKYV